MWKQLMEYCRYSCIMVVVVVIVVVVVVVVVLWWLLWLLLLYYDQPVLSECFVFPITYRYYGPGKNACLALFVGLLRTQG
jgi:hypothetical protein